MLAAFAGNQPTAVTTATVPNVIGLQADNAASTLEQHSFKVARAYQYSTQPLNTVVDQKPGAETTAAKGSIVTITISQGQQTTTMPDVRGKQIADAQQELNAAPYKSAN